MRRKIINYSINMGIILAISILTFIYLLKDNAHEVIGEILSLNVFSITIIFAVVALSFLIEGLIIKIATVEYKKDFKIYDGVFVSSIRALFSAITPLKLGALGGQIYGYVKKEVSTKDAFSSTFKTSYAFRVNLLLISILVFIFTLTNDINVDILNYSFNARYIAVLGIVFNFVIFFLYPIVVFSKKLHNIFLKITSFFGFKFKRINCKECYINESKDKLKTIQDNLIKFYKNTRESFSLILLYVFKSFFMGGFPYLIYLLLTGDSFSVSIFFASVCLVQLHYFASAIVPIPGASGASELIFLALFAYIFPMYSLIASVLILWRIFTYFFNIVFGLINFIIIKCKKS